MKATKFQPHTVTTAKDFTLPKINIKQKKKNYFFYVIALMFLYATDLFYSAPVVASLLV